MALSFGPAASAAAAAQIVEHGRLPDVETRAVHERRALTVLPAAQNAHGGLGRFGVVEQDAAAQAAGRRAARPAAVVGGGAHVQVGHGGTQQRHRRARHRGTRLARTRERRRSPAHDTLSRSHRHTDTQTRTHTHARARTHSRLVWQRVLSRRHVKRLHRPAAGGGDHGHRPRPLPRQTDPPSAPIWTGPAVLPRAKYTPRPGSGRSAFYRLPFRPATRAKYTQRRQRSPPSANSRRSTWYATHPSDALFSPSVGGWAAGGGRRPVARPTDRRTPPAPGTESPLSLRRNSPYRFATQRSQSTLSRSIVTSPTSPPPPPRYRSAAAAAESARVAPGHASGSEWPISFLSFIFAFDCIRVSLAFHPSTCAAFA